MSEPHRPSVPVPLEAWVKMTPEQRQEYYRSSDDRDPRDGEPGLLMLLVAYVAGIFS